MTGQRPKPRRCAQCGTVLPPGCRRSRRYCGSRCRSSAWWDTHRRKRRVAEIIAVGGEQYRAWLTGTEPRRPRKTCPVCGKTWAAAISRTDAVYCRNACRQKAWRLRRRPW